jgi:hypothetical protein
MEKKTILEKKEGKLEKKMKKKGKKHCGLLL